MKKFVVLFVVAALTCFGSMAFAADVTVSGSIDIRSRDFTDLNLNKNTDSTVTNTDQRDTQERIRINVDAKAGNDVKGRISVENGWDSWGRYEIPQGNGQTAITDRGIPGLTQGGVNDVSRIEVREAWISFNLPGVPINVTGGHQLLQLGNGWWVRSMKYGSDAWVVANVTGNNTAAFVDVKASEGAFTGRADDIDTYVLLDVYKINDNNTVGIDVSYLYDRLGLLSGTHSGTGPDNVTAFGPSGSDIYNIGLNYNGKVGPVGLKAEVDFQGGKVKAVGAEPKFKGYQAVIEGNVPLDPITLNFTLAYGSGSKEGDTDIKQYVNLLDADQHYTLLYEYKIKTAVAQNSGTGGATSVMHTGFANTTAVNVGAMWAATQSLGVGLDFWWLRATEDVSLNGAAADSDLGYEIDAKVNWKLYDNLTWNWVLGYFAPGKAYDFANKSADKATGIQGVLSFKF